MKKRTVCFSILLMSICLTGCNGGKALESEPANYEFQDVSVHDPSILRVDDEYYIFGSHLAAAKSSDLMNWEFIGNGVKNDSPIIPKVMEEMKESFAWSKTNTFWAPDVIQLKSDQRYYMYYCTCEGSQPLSTLGIAVSDNVEGPYENLGIILKSGMTKESSENGDSYNAAFHPNTVDPCVFYDAQDRLWMVYGSYSGGIYILELNPDTGFPLEKGYGKKLLGANHLRIEAPYILYNPDTKYYYMFLSFGGLDSDGGYQIRVCRSENPDGPYYDSSGQDMADCKGGMAFDDATASLYGLKMNGNYKWLWKEGEEGENRLGYLSPGHNSAIYEEESGKYFITFHTRFENSGELHNVRTHQMFFNEDGWPVMAPYRYTGETIGEYKKNDMAGEYKFINHGREISPELTESQNITLTKSGKIEGDVTGSWKLEDKNRMVITIDDTVYKGIAIRAYDEFGKKMVMTFSAAADNGVTIWGSHS